jgi:hypothetical protein
MKSEGGALFACPRFKPKAGHLAGRTEFVERTRGS